MGMSVFMRLSLVVLAFCLFAGLSAEDMVLKNPGQGDMYTLKQEKTLAEVRALLPSIKVGMELKGVLALLGSPGIVHHNGFTYHDRQPDGSLLLGSRRGEVRFTREGDLITKVDDIADATGSIKPLR